MNPEAVEWLESQPLIHPWVAAYEEDYERTGPAAIRQMIELIDDHDKPAHWCLQCGRDPIVL